MTQTVDGRADTAPVTTDVLRVLVISQHDVVRRGLVLYLGRFPKLTVSGDLFSYQAIVSARPDVLVLDLSQLTLTEIRRAIDATQRVDARLIALASMYDPAAERAVTGSGGLYHLKSATVDALADVVRDTGRRCSPPAMPRQATAQR